MLRADAPEGAKNGEILAVQRFQSMHLRSVARLRLLAQIKIGEDQIKVVHNQFLDAHFPAWSSCEAQPNSGHP